MEKKVRWLEKVVPMTQTLFKGEGKRKKDIIWRMSDPLRGRRRKCSKEKQEEEMILKINEWKKCSQVEQKMNEEENEVEKI